MRLTDKIVMDKIVVYGCKATYPERVNNRNETSDVTNIPEIINKLGQLEDIEDELGIDLITFFKLINVKNVYSYGNTSIMKNTGQVDIYDRTIMIWNGSCHQVYPLSEYGKSFALTKEELCK